LWLLIVWSALPSVIAIEDLSVSAAISRVFRVARGGFWMTIILLVVIFAIAFLLSTGTAIPVSIILALIRGNALGTQESVLFTALTLLLTTISSSLTFLIFSLLAVAASLNYFNLVENRESVGLNAKIAAIGAREGSATRAGVRSRVVASIILLLVVSAPLFSQADSYPVAEEPPPPLPDSIAVDSAVSDSLPLEVEMDSATVARYADTSGIALRTPNATMLDSLRSNSDFIYERVEDPETFGERVRRWFNDLLGTAFSSDAWAEFWKVFRYILLGGVVIFVLYRLIKDEKRGVFVPTSKTTVPHEVIEEDIHAIDYAALISAAERNGDYRRASRYHYLRSLKKLSDGGKISWSREKTNRDYGREIGSGPLADAFARITLLFDYIWYGESAIDDKTYDAVCASFERFGRVLEENA
jgi:hypothetical protein